MHIYSKTAGPLSPDTTTRAAQAADVSDSPTVQPVPPVSATIDRSDKVQISDAGRALAARKDGGSSVGSLDPARADRIRGRILSGAYDTLDVVDAVARRLLDTGDL